MDRKHTESGGETLTTGVEDAFVLPPAVKTTHDEAGPPRDPNAPSGSLSSDDAEVVPVVFSSGAKAE